MSYEKFGRRFFEIAVTENRIGAAFTPLAGEDFEIGPLATGPGGMAKAGPGAADDEGRQARKFAAVFDERSPDFCRDVVLVDAFGSAGNRLVHRLDGHLRRCPDMSKLFVGFDEAQGFDDLGFDQAGPKRAAQQVGVAAEQAANQLDRECRAKTRHMARSVAGA